MLIRRRQLLRRGRRRHIRAGQQGPRRPQGGQEGARVGLDGKFGSQVGADRSGRHQGQPQRPRLDPRVGARQRRRRHHRQMRQRPQQRRHHRRPVPPARPRPRRHHRRLRRRPRRRRNPRRMRERPQRRRRPRHQRPRPRRGRHPRPRQTATPTSTSASSETPSSVRCQQASSTHARLRTDGAIRCWGYNTDGEADAPSGTFSAVSAGYEHSCGLRTDGAIQCWGSNRDGQTNVPVGAFTAVSAGSEHTCALERGGSVRCWGNNSDGQSDAPVQHDSSAVSAGDDVSCGVTTSGAVTCWGAAADWSGASTGPYTAVAAGGTNSCALGTGGTITCRLNQGRPIFPGTQPEQPVGAFSAISVNESHGCGLTVAKSHHVLGQKRPRSHQRAPGNIHLGIRRLRTLMRSENRRNHHLLGQVQRRTAVDSAGRLGAGTVHRHFRGERALVRASAPTEPSLVGAATAGNGPTPAGRRPGRLRRRQGSSAPSQPGAVIHAACEPTGRSHAGEETTTAKATHPAASSPRRAPATTTPVV